MKNDEFSNVFGEFDARGAGDKQYRPSIITEINDGRAHPCNICGKYPKVHDVYFSDKVKNSKHFYITCEICGSCNGEWYETEEDAIKAWNEKNPNEVVKVDKDMIESHDFIKKIVDDMRLTD